MTDLELYQRVRNDALAGAGISLTLRNTLLLTDTLADAFGDNFDIEHACHALTQSQKWAEILKCELREAKGDDNEQP